MDYDSRPYNVTFPAGQTTATFDVPINDDNILEGNENFMLTINSSSLLTDVTRGDPGQATVTIMDNDRKLLLSYTEGSCAHFHLSGSLVNHKMLQHDDCLLVHFVLSLLISYFTS